MTAALTLRVMRLPHAEGLAAPAYESRQAAGLDLPAAVPDTAPVTLGPAERAVIPTGFAIALPEGFEAQIRPRSGLAAKHGITVLNTPGTIDADYRGEIKVILINHGRDPYVVERGARIAQMVIAPVVQASIQPVAALDATERGDAGFGSSGVKSGTEGSGHAE